MGYGHKITGHGFRALFSTVLNDHGFDSKIVDHQLAHVGRDKTEAAYNRAEYMKARPGMMQWWGHFLDVRRSPKHRITLVPACPVRPPLQSECCWEISERAR